MPPFLFWAEPIDSHAVQPNRDRALVAKLDTSSRAPC